MQPLEVSCAVRRIYTSLGAKGLRLPYDGIINNSCFLITLVVREFLLPSVMLQIAPAFLIFCSVRLQDKHVGLSFCCEDSATILPKRRRLPIRLHDITFQKTITFIHRENLKRYCRLINLLTLSTLAQ